MFSFSFNPILFFECLIQYFSCTRKQFLFDACFALLELFRTCHVKTFFVTVMFPLWQHSFLCNCFCSVISIVHLYNFMWFSILGMITYYAQYISSYKLSIIAYHIFSVIPIFLTQGFHSEYNCLINHNIFVLNKSGYQNPDPNSDSFYYCGLQ